MSLRRTQSNISDTASESTESLLRNLEKRASELTSQYVHLTGSLQSSLSAVADILSRYTDLHARVSSDLNDKVSEAVSEMQKFVARCRDLDKEMAAVEDLGKDVVEVKTLLEQLERGLSAQLVQISANPSLL